jgi:dTDP-4-amino-4,6-dideoxygalactose transaminase
MMIPFSPPFIDASVEAQVMEVLKSGWITTGPKVDQLQKFFCQYTGSPHALAVNSWTSGAQLVLKWFGVGPGDEVIVPAYTYASTAIVVLHAGAKPVMVDVKDDFNIDEQELARAITSRTKAIIPVDFAGWPADYDTILEVLEANRHLFRPRNQEQKMLGRPLVLADAAHSLGALIDGKAAGLKADFAVYSFHAVKNITSAEGGMIGINLPQPFDTELVQTWMRINSLNGQTRDALSKSKGRNWRYDIVSDGLKINMPDICGAIALAQLQKYEEHLLPERKRVVERYMDRLSEFEWAELPPVEDERRTSSYHIFALRIRGVSEKERDALIDTIFDKQVSVNVHFQPLPMLTLFRDLGYKMEDFPNAYNNYCSEITLPVYPQLNNQLVERVLDAVEASVHQMILV